MVLLRWIMFWKHEIGEQQINCFTLIAILSFFNLSSYTRNTPDVYMLLPS